MMARFAEDEAMAVGASGAGSGARRLMTTPAVRTVVIVLLIGLLVAACGRRGALEPPGTPTNENRSAPEAIFAPDEQVEPPPPDRDFILDPLL